METRGKHECVCVFTGSPGYEEMLQRVERRKKWRWREEAQQRVKKNHKHIYVQTYMCVCICAFAVYACVHIPRPGNECMYKWMWLCIHKCCARMCPCVCVCMHVCLLSACVSECDYTLCVYARMRARMYDWLSSKYTCRSHDIIWQWHSCDHWAVWFAWSYSTVCWWWVGRVLIHILTNHTN